MPVASSVAVPPDIDRPRFWEPTLAPVKAMVASVNWASPPATTRPEPDVPMIPPVTITDERSPDSTPVPTRTPIDDCAVDDTARLVAVSDAVSVAPIDVRATSMPIVAPLTPHEVATSAHPPLTATPVIPD